jgi:hypothetical protein
LEVRDDELIIRSARKMRGDWEASFAKMSDAADDVLLDGDVPGHGWDKEEWTW